MTRLTTIFLFLAFTTWQVLGEETIPANPGESPPPVMQGGKGKGKGKGRVLPPAPSAPVPGSPPTPSTPPQAPASTPPAQQNAGADFFARKIQPVLQQKCFECHQTGRKMKGGLAVDSHAALLAGGDSGPALVPGDAAKSLLYESITHCCMKIENQIWGVSSRLGAWNKKFSL